MISHGVEISIAGGGADEKDGAREGSFFFFLFSFFFFFYQVFVVKVQETTWSASYGRNKTMKQSNGPLHLLMGQTKYPPPVGKQSNMKTETVPPRPYGMGLTAHQPPA